MSAHSFADDHAALRAAAAGGAGLCTVVGIDGSFSRRLGAQLAVHPDGSGNRPLTGPVTTLVDQLPSNVSPAWSPDGQHIVYLSSRGADESEGPWRLWVMDASGENKRPLPIDLEFAYQHNMEQMVSWGP